MEQVSLDKRHHRTKREKGRPQPKLKARFKELWATPEFRAKMDKVYAARRADPLKSWTRKGVPDGYTKETAAVMWAEARETAQRMLKKMTDTKVFDLENMPKEDADRAEAAMRVNLEIMFSGLNTEQRLRAAAKVLEFTKAKPEQKKRIAVENAEAWLESVIADESQSKED